MGFGIPPEPQTARATHVRDAIRATVPQRKKFVLPAIPTMQAGTASSDKSIATDGSL